MKERSLKITILIVFLLELLALIYLTFIAYWLSYWLIDDSVAFSMNQTEWVKIAIYRMFIFSIIAIIFSVICYFISKYLLNKNEIIKSKRIAIINSIIVFLSILVSSMIGGIKFITEKPWF